MRVAVICIGNELLLDEGVGPACGRYLAARYELPTEVDVLDRAVMGMAIISDLRSYDRALVLDAVEVPGAEPGALFSFAPEDAATSGPGTLSLHEMRFADVLAAAALMGVSCEGHCLGVQVENMSPANFTMGLTPRVAAAVPLLAAAAARWLRDELGLEVCDRLDDEDAVAASQLRSTLPMPQVIGAPDVSVMTRYLTAGLRAVGAEIVGDPRGTEGSDRALERVVCTVPGCAGEAATAFAELAARLGPRVELGLAVDGDATGRALLVVDVRPTTNDHDCDVVIGAVQRLVRSCATMEGDAR
ncbi:MAG: hydrogenase maturation protease [Coriobacteriia bacterium]|nr:hydrogenase maturation protease [Coriobacteriia bacterium]MBS5477149.1 hydrogenase maturation protease [Coriobacteriia bacterium]